MENYRCKAKETKKVVFEYGFISMLKLFLYVRLFLFLDPYQKVASSGITVPVPLKFHPSRKRSSAAEVEKFETMAEKVTKFTSKTARFIV